MVANQKIIYVYDDFSFDEPILLGLRGDTIRGEKGFLVFFQMLLQTGGDESL